MTRFAWLTLLLMLMSMCLASTARGDEPTEDLAPIAFLAGEFSGQGKHQYGSYDETVEAHWTLAGTALELRSRSTMQGSVVFEDLRVFSWDAAAKTMRMRQWSAGLLRVYSGKENDAGAWVFEETAREGAAPDTWRYTFEPSPESGFSYRVDAKTTGDWKPYVSGALAESLKDPGKGGGMGIRQYETSVAGMSAQVHHPDGKGPFPVIVFSPGGAANTFQGYRPYGRWYATWGYVTVIVAFDDASAEERAPKFSKVLDWLAEANARAGDPLAGMLDLDRVAAAGHSRGGNAALRAARADPRFIACLAMAPSGPTEAVAGEGKARTCIFGASEDTFLEAGKKAYATTPGERVLIVVKGMEHMLGPREATLAVVERSTAFLEYALKGDARYRAALTKEREGLTITATTP